MASSVCRPLTSEEIAEISAVHLIETPVLPADLLFVFGTRENTDGYAKLAGRLWHDGFYRWAIVSGGLTPGASYTECQIIRTAMIAGGVPEGRILEEHRATNTGENVIFSLPVIDAALGLANVRRVICLGNSWTARRYPMTLHRHWPDVEKSLVTVDHFGVPRREWFRHPEFRRRVLREWDKIETYKALGYIAEWPAGRTG